MESPSPPPNPDGCGFAGKFGALSDAITVSPDVPSEARRWRHTVIALLCWTCNLFAGRCVVE